MIILNTWILCFLTLSISFLGWLLCLIGTFLFLKRLLIGRPLHTTFAHFKFLNSTFLTYPRLRFVLFQNLFGFTIWVVSPTSTPINGGPNVTLGPRVRHTHYFEEYPCGRLVLCLWAPLILMILGINGIRIFFFFVKSTLCIQQNKSQYAYITIIWCGVESIIFVNFVFNNLKWENVFLEAYKCYVIILNYYKLSNDEVVTITYVIYIYSQVSTEEFHSPIYF